MYEVLNGLEPACFFKWFGEISRIPRGSRKEGQIIAFCQEFAQKRSLECEVDQRGNVFMRVPATKGYEKEPPVLLQAHLDMVWVKDPGVEFDFEIQPIQLLRQDNWLIGDGTTLGADNGVGVATMLALADEQDIPHPPLELLFTVEEEVGLKGIRCFDMSKIKARRMLNMDCGYTHELCVSSAGATSSAIEKVYNVTSVPAEDVVLKVAITGGKSGHSGIMIWKGRACAGNEMGELMAALEEIPVKLCAISTAEKAILGACTVVVSLPKDCQARAVQLLEERFAEIQGIYRGVESNLTLSIAAEQAVTCVDPKATRQIFTAMRLMRTGVYRLNENDPSITITSGALLPIIFKDGKLSLRYNIRSANDADMDALYRKMARLAELLDMELIKRDRYSGWPERTNSAFLEKFQNAHLRVCGYPADLERVHGGIEVGMIVGAIPDMDAVGYAPTARGAHTTKEYLVIDEVKPYWEVLKEVLAAKG